MIYGVTGKSGVGKNWTIDNVLNAGGNFEHIDIDTIGHKSLMYPEVQTKLINAFGTEIVKANSVDRKMLADLVFNSRKDYDKMADATWEIMDKLIWEAISDDSKNYILNWILLPQTRFFYMCDKLFLIKRNDTDRMNGLIDRDKTTRERILDRDRNSIEYDETLFDFIIYNNN